MANELKIPKFWCRHQAELRGADGEMSKVAVCGWSFTSGDDALRTAKQIASKLLSRLQSGQPFQGRYAYGERPMREEILKEIQDADGKVTAAITRNSYGCMVLNTANVMFVDVDLPAPSAGGVLKSMFGRLFGGKEEAPSAGPEQEAIAKLESFVSAHPAWSARVYRTFGGLRYLITHDFFDPEARTTIAALEELGADPQYVKLCRLQKSFRARLTPKPWRCGSAYPPARFPFVGEDERRYREWEEEYQSAQQGFATCRFEKTVGRPVIAEAVAPLVKLHDELTACAGNSPLA